MVRSDCFFCDECIEVCNDILADHTMTAAAVTEESGTTRVRGTATNESARRSYPIGCSLCALPVVLEEALAIPERGFLCPGCTTAVQAAIAERSRN
jgi:predicted molibdopterin-dependent oxidoreductase YjgC